MNFNWTLIAQDVSKGINVLAPIAESLAPEAAAAIAIANKIIQGLIAAEPTAVALVKQIQSGTPATAAQLSEYYATYKIDDDALNADIAEHIQTLGG